MLLKKKRFPTMLFDKIENFSDSDKENSDEENSDKENSNE